MLTTRARRGMNTDLALTVRVDAPSPDARAAAEAALTACAEWLEAMERRFSRFLPESELSALNAAAGSTRVVSEDLFTVIALALEAMASTDGLFDPTVLPALRAAGYDHSFDQIGQREVGAAAHGARSAAPRHGRGREVRLDAARRAITLPEGAALDLGGIAKGWAADALAARFLDPFPAYLIDLGGDMRVRGGPKPGTPWLIAIEDAREAPMLGAKEAASSGPRYLAGMHVSAGAVATSGDARRWWLRDGRRMHHLIHPHTGEPVRTDDGRTDDGRRLVAVTALAPTAAEADVLAKVAFLRGAPDGLRWLARGAASAGVCAFADGSLEASENLEEYLHAMALSPAHP